MRLLNSARYALSIGAAAAVLAGCGSGQPPIAAPPSEDYAKTSVAHWIYVSNEIPDASGWASSVNVYSALVNGNAAPTFEIVGSQTQLSQVNGIVADEKGEIYVANSDTNEIVGFAPSSNGNVAPNVVIAGTKTHLAWPVGLAIDAAGNLYVGNCGRGCGHSSAQPALLEFSARSNGNVAPARVISGSRTHLQDANEPALDAQGDIYVSNWVSDTIVEFTANAHGNVRPIREIAGGKTFLSQPDGIAIDRFGLYAVSSNQNFVERFRPSASGDASPVAVVSGTNTQLDNPDGIFPDAQGVIYLANFTGHDILKFAPLANGDKFPIGELSGSNTQLVNPCFVYVR